MNTSINNETRLRKYSRQDIKQEAQLFLHGDSIPTISRKLGIPVSTVSWHLIHPLRRINYPAWLTIRYKLIPRAKNLERKIYEEDEIEQSGLIDLIDQQWGAIEEERRSK